MRAHLSTRLRLSDPQRSTLAEIGKRLGRKALEQVACVAKPDTIFAWYRRLVAQKFDGSRQRSYPGRPPVQHEIVELVVQMARENPGWGYDRMAGALANLGHAVSDQTVGNILRRHGLAPAPESLEFSAQPTWEIAYNHFHNRLGHRLPKMAAVLPTMRPTGVNHHMNWETLTHAEMGAMGLAPVKKATLF